MPGSPAAPALRTGATERRAIVEEALAQGDIRIDGPRPWDLQLHDDRFFKRVLAEDALGLGESCVEGWWDAEALDAFLFRLLGIDLSRVRMSWRRKGTILRDRLLNRQRGRRAFVVGEQHYDRGNDLFQTMLDPLMTYTCGYWKDAETLEAAQRAKLDLVCRQIGGATERLFVMEDWHHSGADHDPTLMAWNANFEAGWKPLRPRYGDRFYRLWRYFLLSAAGSFRVRKMQLWQVVFSKNGLVDGYTPVR